MTRNQLTLRIWYALGWSPWPAAGLPAVVGDRFAEWVRA